jgi:TatD DNase family protein
LFDTHCHFNLEGFQDDLEQVIALSRRGGVHSFLVPGVGTSSSKESISLSRRYPGVVFSAAGIHPNYSAGADAADIFHLVNEHPGFVIAIGEIGLDFYRTHTSPEDQIRILEAMLAIAKEKDLPICLHNRDADDELIRILSNWYFPSTKAISKTGVFHAFTGSESVAKWGLDHQFYFGIGGQITYKTAEDLRYQIKKIGLDWLVLETDSPYLSPIPHRGERNTPANLSIIAQALADCLSTDLETIIEATDRNASRLFGLD